MLLATARWPLQFDCYLLRYPQGSAIASHTDSVSEVKQGSRYVFSLGWVLPAQKVFR